MAFRVLITGGSGFVGQALAIRLRETHDVVLASRSHEANLRAQRHTGCRAVSMDVARLESVRDTLLRERPDAVVHAAASKHVGIAERLPHEVIDVNVAGAQNVARAAVERGTAALVGVSTDKAAPPVSTTYGLTKALAERLFCTLDDPAGTRFACVRLGNVAWSTGSVFPEWRRMHEASGVITSTGPDMRRFFMPVADAAELTAAALRHVATIGGRVLSSPLGAARIRDLLDVWIEQHGGRWVPGQRRPGDQDDEWLIGDSEARWTEELVLDGRPRLVLGPGVAAARPLPAGVSTATAPALEREALRALLAEPGEGRPGR